MRAFRCDLKDGKKIRQKELNEKTQQNARPATPVNKRGGLNERRFKCTYIRTNRPICWT